MCAPSITIAWRLLISGIARFMRAEALLDAVADRRLEDLPAVERQATASRVTSSSVGPRPPEMITNCAAPNARRTVAGQPLAIVADHVLGRHFDAQIVQLLGEEKRIGIDPLGRQHLRADRDDLGVHRSDDW